MLVEPVQPVCATKILPDVLGSLDVLCLQEGGIKGFLKRAKANLHCILCLRTAAGWHRLRQQLPGLDASAFAMHIAPWSQAALQHVAMQQISRLPLGRKQGSTMQAALAAMCQLMHTGAVAELQNLPSSAPRCRPGSSRDRLLHV